MSNIIELNDINAPQMDVYARLTEPQLRSKIDAEKGIFIAESAKVVKLALENGVQPISLLIENKQKEAVTTQIITYCDEHYPDIPIYSADAEVLKQITGFHLCGGVLAAMKRPKPLSVEQVCSGAKRIAVLEGITDSTNVGAIFRSAAAMNIDGVLITKTCCDPLCRRSVRVSMGTVLQIPWARIGSSAKDWQENGIDTLTNLGFKTAAMALSDESVSIDNENVVSEEKLCIIFGTEGDGLADSTIAKCDYTVKIPMYHGVDSLNVAAASAVAFWVLGNKQLTR